MPIGGKSGGGLSGFIGGVAENIFVNICTAAVGFVCVRVGLSKSDKLEDWSNWPIWLGLAGMAVLVTSGANVIRLSFLRWRIRGGSGDKIALLIAGLEGDCDSRIRETIRESLRRELGQAIEIIFWPESLALADGHDADAEAKAETTAQKWLKKKSCDILLWGRVKANEVVSLRTTVAEGKSSSAASYA
jgi:hypothetical protein